MTKLSAGGTVGQWTLIDYIPGVRTPERATPRWLCQCSCGVKRAVQASNLQQGRSLSCGHDISERTSEAMRRYHAANRIEHTPAPSANPFAAARAYLSGASHA